MTHVCTATNGRGDVCVIVCEAPILIQGMHSVLDTVVKRALLNKVKEVMVMDGIAVEGLPDPKRLPIILSSDGREADVANLLQDNDSKEIKKEVEKVSDNGSNNVLPTTAFVGGISGDFILMSIEGDAHIRSKGYTGSRRSGHFNRITGKNHRQ